jgi:hypothetical protein
MMTRNGGDFLSQLAGLLKTPAQLVRKETGWGLTLLTLVLALLRGCSPAVEYDTTPDPALSGTWTGNEFYVPAYCDEGTLVHTVTFDGARFTWRRLEDRCFAPVTITLEGTYQTARRTYAIALSVDAVRVNREQMVLRERNYLRTLPWAELESRLAAHNVDTVPELAEITADERIAALTNTYLGLSQTGKYMPYTQQGGTETLQLDRLAPLSAGRRIYLTR